MGCVEKTNKIRKLITRMQDNIYRGEFADKLRKKGIAIKKAITIGALAISLAMPTIASADTQFKFAWEDNTCEILFQDWVDKANERDREISSDNWSPYVNIQLTGENVFEVEIHNNEDDFMSNGKKIVHPDLLSNKGQEELLKMIENLSTVDKITVKSSLPVDTVLNIKNLGCQVILEDDGTAIIGVQEYIKLHGATAIYSYGNPEQNEYEDPNSIYLKKVVFESDFMNLKEDEIALMTFDTFQKYDDFKNRSNAGKICVQIDDFEALTKEDLMNLRGKVDFIRIDEDIQAHSLEDYIEIHKAIDDMVADIDPKASDLEKALIIYYKLGKSITYCKGDNQANLYGALVEKNAVCTGISEAFKQVYERVGGNAEVIIASNHGALVGHAYNQIMINGTWVDIDLTGDLKYIQNNETPIMFGNRFVEFDTMSVNHKTENRGILKQDIVEQLYEKIAKKYEREPEREPMNNQNNDDLDR